GGSFRPDLADNVTLASFGIGQVYEIKSVYSAAAAVAQNARDVAILNAFTAFSAQKLIWIPGFTYLAPPVVPISPTTIAFISQPAPGIILYCIVNTTELLLLAALALAAAFALLLSEIEIGVLVEEFA